MSSLLVTNYWHPGPETRQDLTFCIDFSVPVERVKRILLAAATELQDHPGFSRVYAPEVLVKQTDSLGVHYDLRYWINAWKDIPPPIARDLVNTSVLNHLRAAGISLAYPKEDVYYARMPIRHYDTLSQKDRRKIIAEVELFSYLPGEDLDYLAQLIRYFNYKPGETIVKSGDEGDAMYILLEGVADVFIEKDGKMIKIDRLSPGQFFGEMALLTGEPRSADVVAATDILVYQIQREHLQIIFGKHPEFVEKVSEIIVDRKYRNAYKLKDHEESMSQEITINTNLLLGKIRAFFKGAKN